MVVAEWAGMVPTVQATPRKRASCRGGLPDSEGLQVPPEMVSRYGNEAEGSVNVTF